MVELKGLVDIIWEQEEIPTKQNGTCQCYARFTKIGDLTVFQNIFIYNNILFKKY